MSETPAPSHPESERPASKSAEILRTAEVRRLRSTLATVLDDLLLHDGYGHIEIDMKILKRGQKEVVIVSGKEYRFVIDYANPRTEEA